MANGRIKLALVAQETLQMPSYRFSKRILC